MRSFLISSLLVCSVALAQTPTVQPADPPTPQNLIPPTKTLEQIEFQENEKLAFDRTKDYRALLNDTLAKLKYGISFNETNEAVGKLEALYDAAESPLSRPGTPNGELVAVRKWRTPLDDLLKLRKVWQRKIACDGWAENDAAPQSLRSVLKDASVSLEAYRSTLITDAQSALFFRGIVHESASSFLRDPGIDPGPPKDGPDDN